MKKISFVVPVFNGEKYLAKCLDSLLVQNIPDQDYEILIINDGSTDATSSIISEYLRRNKNIRSIDQFNKGLAETRNVGLSNATGVYIWFIDADDYIIENCALNIVNFAFENSIDMFLVAPSAKVTSDFMTDWENLFEKRIIAGRDLLENECVDVGAWAYLLKKEYINSHQLKFLAGAIFEDAEFIPRALYSAKKISYLNFSVYHYIQHANSIMHTFSPARLGDYIKVADSLNSFRLIHAYDSVAFRYFTDAVTGLVLAGFKAIAKNDLSREHLLSYIGDCRARKLIPLAQPNAGLKRLVAIRLASYIPSVYVRFLKLKKLVKN